MTLVESIPRTLAERPIWLAYRLEDRGSGRLSKPPVSPRTGRVCAKTDETEHVTLTEALVGMERWDLDGVGVVLPDDICCIDLDSPFDESSGQMLDIPSDIFDHFRDTYVEYSPSGNGLHIFFFGSKPYPRTKDSKAGIEVYTSPAFLTVTGDRVEGTTEDLTECQDALDYVFAEYLPPIVAPNAEPIVVEHGDKTADEWLMFALTKDAKLQALYQCTDHDGDESSTDFALLNKLAYWLNRDADAIEKAFMASPWVSTKDAYHIKKLERADYLPDSVAKAVALTTTTAYDTSKTYETKAIRFFTLTPDDAGELTLNLEDYTDLGNATALAKVFSEVLVYTPEWGWCFFDGTRWTVDVNFRAMEASKDIALALKTTAQGWLDRVRADLDDEGIDPESDEGKARLKSAKDLYAHALKSQSEHGITAMVTLNKAFMQSSAKTFNADPWLLNTPKGVVDLKTGETMPHDAGYRLTHTTSVSPEDIPTPMFDQFLDRIFCGDADLIAFVQKVVGSALVGKVYAENLIIANGTGANGKSTLFNTIQYLLGDYATAIDPDLLMSSKPHEQQVGMAMLEGRRFAVAQETEEGQRLRSSMLKRCVSTDTMVAKRLYKDPHEFHPSHTLVLSTNHLPKVSSTDLGTWRRIIVLPFMATIPASEIITDFHSLLIEREGAGILKWAVDGAVKFWESGCDISEKPEAVVTASAEYRSDEDWIARFVGECCVADDESIVRHSDLYRAYHHWAKANGETYIRSSNVLGRSLATAGWRSESAYDAQTKLTSKGWRGWRLSETRTFRLVQKEAS